MRSYAWCLCSLASVCTAAVITSGSSACQPLSLGPLAHDGIPRAIHQVWIKSGDSTQGSRLGVRNVSSRNQASAASWLEGMPGYAHKVWGNDEIRKLISQHFPWFLTVYDGYALDIMRADAARYVLMYAIGGLYVDSDVALLEALPPELFGNRDISLLFLSRTGGCAVMQHMFASAPRAEFWKVMIDCLGHVGRCIDTVYATGPGVMLRCFNFARQIGMNYTLLNTTTLNRFVFHASRSTWGEHLPNWLRQHCDVAGGFDCAASKLKNSNPHLDALEKACYRRCILAQNFTIPAEMNYQLAPPALYGQHYLQRHGQCVLPGVHPPKFSDSLRTASCVISRECISSGVKRPVVQYIGNARRYVLRVKASDHKYSFCPPAGKHVAALQSELGWQVAS